MIVTGVEALREMGLGSVVVPHGEGARRLIAFCLTEGLWEITGRSGMYSAEVLVSLAGTEIFFVLRKG